MRAMRRRAALVFKEIPGTSRRPRCAYAVEEPGGRDGRGRLTNRDGPSLHPLIERGPVDAHESTDADARKGRFLDQVAELALTDAGIAGERLQIEPLGPRVDLVRGGTGANLAWCDATDGSWAWVPPFRNSLDCTTFTARPGASGIRLTDR
jgi:hypothetical protein